MRFNSVDFQARQLEAVFDGWLSECAKDWQAHENSTSEMSDQTIGVLMRSMRVTLSRRGMELV